MTAALGAVAGVGVTRGSAGYAPRRRACPITEAYAQVRRLGQVGLGGGKVAMYTCPCPPLMEDPRPYGRVIGVGRGLVGPGSDLPPPSPLSAQHHEGVDEVRQCTHLRYLPVC